MTDVGSQDRDSRLLRIHQAKRERDVPFLIGALTDPDIRHRAAKFLGDLGTLEAIPPLIRLLDARDPHSRASAATALGKLRAREATPRLIVTATEEEPWWVRSWAIVALGEIGDDDAIFNLLANFLRDEEDYRVRRAAAVALGSLGDTRAIPLLIDARRRLGWRFRRRQPYSRVVRTLRRQARRIR